MCTMSYADFEAAVPPRQHEGEGGDGLPGD